MMQLPIMMKVVTSGGRIVPVRKSNGGCVRHSVTMTFRLNWTMLEKYKHVVSVYAGCRSRRMTYPSKTRHPPL